MKIIVGLGNPGKEYEKTRHNVGFMVLDKLALDNNLVFKAVKKFEVEMSEFNVKDDKIILVKPQTFMNLSGQAVQKIAAFYKIRPEDIWVVADEYDLPLGTIRTRLDFESSSHKGILNIVECLQTKDFRRVRVGVFGQSKMTIDDFVLAKFEKREASILAQVIEKTAQMVERMLAEQFTAHTIDLNE